MPIAKLTGVTITASNRRTLARILALLEGGAELGDHMDGSEFIAQLRAKREAANR